MKNNLAIYQAKRPVAAARIVDTYPEGIRNSRLTVEDSTGKRTVLEVGTDWFATHRPHEDGYFLDYGDGYTGFMVAHAFDRLYALDTDFREVEPVDIGTKESAILQDVIDVAKSVGLQVIENSRFATFTPPMVFGPLDSIAILIEKL